MRMRKHGNVADSINQEKNKKYDNVFVCSNMGHWFCV